LSSTILSYQLIPEEIGEELPILRSIKTVTIVVYWSDGTSLVGTLDVIVYIVLFGGFHFNSSCPCCKEVHVGEIFLMFDAIVYNKVHIDHTHTAIDSSSYGRSSLSPLLSLNTMGGTCLLWTPFGV
jgi:hypothetical protein